MHWFQLIYSLSLCVGVLQSFHSELVKAATTLNLDLGVFRGSSHYLTWNLDFIGL